MPQLVAEVHAHEDVRVIIYHQNPGPGLVHGSGSYDNTASRLTTWAGQLAARSTRRPTKRLAERGAQLVWVEGFEHTPLGAPRPDVSDDVART